MVEEQKTHKKLYCAEVQIGQNGRQNLVHYDAKKLLRSMGIGTLFCQGTVFTLTKNVYVNILEYSTVCFMIATVAYFFDLSDSFVTELQGGTKALSSTLKRLTPFVFGLFLSLTMKRWWDLRVGELGVVMGSIVQNVSFVSQFGCRVDMSPTERKEFEGDCIHLARLGVASLECVAQNSRGDFSFDALMMEGILTAEEARILEPRCARAQVLWSWGQALGAELLDKCLPGTHAPNHNPWMAECTAASYAISRMEAFQDCQLPFPYVHMLVMLVGVNNMVLCVILGLNVAVAARGGPWYISVPDLMHLILVPSMYQALLEICFLMEDPLGDDLTDFPMMALQAACYDTARDIIRASFAFWNQQRAQDPSKQWLGGPRQKPEAVAPAASSPLPVQPLPTPVPARRPCSPSPDAADLLLQAIRSSATRPSVDDGIAADVANLSALALEYGYSEFPAANARAALAREAVGPLLPLGAPVICMLGADDDEGALVAALVAAVAGRSAERLAELGAVVVLLSGHGSTQRAFVTGFGDAFPTIVRLVDEGAPPASAAGGGARAWRRLSEGTDSQLVAELLGLLCDVCVAATGGPETVRQVQLALDRGAAVLPLCCEVRSSGVSGASTSGFQPATLPRPSWASEEQWRILQTPPSQSSVETVAATAADLLCSRAAVAADLGDAARGDPGGRRRRALAKLRRECRSEELRLRDLCAQLPPSLREDSKAGAVITKFDVAGRGALPLLRLPGPAEATPCMTLSERSDLTSL